MPPQHGKSVGASTLLPAYLLGRNPDLRIAIASYSASLASKFNRRVQRIIDSPEYAAFFPETTIKRGARPPEYLRTADEVEIIGHRGGLLSVGREGRSRATVWTVSFSTTFTKMRWRPIRPSCGRTVGSGTPRS